MKPRLLLSLLAIFTLAGCSPLSPGGNGQGDGQGQGEGEGQGQGEGDDQETDTTIHVESVSFDVNEDEWTVGDREEIGISISPSNATNKNVRYSSSNTAIADVDYKGKVTCYAPGTVVITVTTEDGNKTDTCTLTIVAKSQPSTTVDVTGLTFNRTTMDLYKGDEESIIATIAPDNATNKLIRWASNNTSVAQVSATGSVLAVGKGTATITATSADNSNIKATCIVNVTEHEEVSNLHEIQKNTILHCWDWSMNNIKNNLDNIKNAGFKTIQISPMQVKKPGNEWWSLYQPMSFRVATSSSENTLGSKTELAEMCEAAEQKGIKVIVDVVANHLAQGNSRTTFDSRVRNYEQEIYDQDLRHKLDQNPSNSNTYTIVQGTLDGLPDLKTENSYVQSRVLSLLKEYIDCGVDGFRFDAAKHIETPDDGQYASNFWTTVLNGTTSYATSKGLDEPYYYGEILQTPGDERSFSYYTKMMSVTDSETGTAVFDSVKDRNTSKLATDGAYNMNLRGENVVLWVESHDTYCNDNVTKSTPEEVINRGYAIQASRKDATTLYFCRPQNGVQDNIGAVGDSTYTLPEVKAANKFHTACIGKDEKISISNGCYVNVRGSIGAAIVAVANSNSTITVDVSLPNGTYSDMVTGNSYTVNNGKVTVTPTKGIVFLMNPDSVGDVPNIIFGSYKEVYSGTQTIPVNVTGATSVTYSIESGEEQPLTGNSVTLGTDLGYDTVAVTVKATNQYGTATQRVIVFKTYSDLVNKSVIIYRCSSDYDYYAWTWNGLTGWHKLSGQGTHMAIDFGQNTSFLIAGFLKGQGPQEGSTEWVTPKFKCIDMSYNGTQQYHAINHISVSN